ITHPIVCASTCANISDIALHKSFLFFFFNETATPKIYTLSLHDALPIYCRHRCAGENRRPLAPDGSVPGGNRCQVRQRFPPGTRSEEHTSELQSQSNLVCRLLLEKKKKKN